MLTALMLLCGACASAAQVFQNDLFKYDNEGAILAYYGPNTDVVIPEEIDGVKIRSIGPKAFFDIGVENVFLNDGIEIIRECAFEGCNVQTVSLSSTVHTVCERAFANCDQMEALFLSNDNASFGKDALIGTGNLLIVVPCTTPHELIEKKIAEAKGDRNFDFFDSHTALSYDEATEYYYCSDCGFRDKDLEGGEPGADLGSLPFDDVPESAWYYEYVREAQKYGIIGGKGNNRFDPDAGLTCAEAAKIAACVYSIKAEDGYSFDQSGKNWYDTYVQYCYDNYIMEDYMVFEWDALATRSQVAYLFSRSIATRHFINDVPLTDIPDVHDTTPHAYEIKDLFDLGIAVGSDENYTFHPDANIKRCEVATMIARMMQEELRIELPKG